MKKSLIKYSGVEFYENYLLPTNPASKINIINSFWKKVPNKFKPSAGYYIESIEKRIWSCYTMGLMHAAHGFVTFNKFTLDEVIFQLLVNVYPILVQIHIHSRCTKILGWKKSKKR